MMRRHLLYPPTMYQTLKLRKLSTGSVFKLVALGSVCSLVPLFVFMSVMAALGAGSVKWNGQAYTGLSGLLMSPLMALGLSLLISALMGSLLALGLWLYSLIRPMHIAYWTDEADADAPR
jgi:hypothetical protein